jgi:hypothetical protein
LQFPRDRSQLLLNSTGGEITSHQRGWDRSAQSLDPGDTLFRKLQVTLESLRAKPEEFLQVSTITITLT